MKVSLLNYRTPDGASDLPFVTPELKAAVIGKYSRSNEGIEAILSKVDLANPEASIDRILKFVDYGHASIGGLTGTIDMTMDGVTMWLAFKLFEVSRRADGQESSTRYIKLDESSLPDYAALGFSEQDITCVSNVHKEGLRLYALHYDALDVIAQKEPHRIRFPEGAKDSTKDRIRKNFALDRARNFLPFCLKTNVVLSQTARDWAETITALASMPQKEANELAVLLTDKLQKVAPHFTRHAKAKPGWTFDQEQEGLPPSALANSTRSSSCTAWVDVATFDAGELLSPELIESRANRYDRCMREVRRTACRLNIPRLAIAELRDLNRHRTGESQAWLLSPESFELPSEINELVPELENARRDYMTLLHGAIKIVARSNKHLLPYAYPLGITVPYQHTMQLDKLIYMIELRTGPGAHFAYASLMRAACESLRITPAGLLISKINVGQAEPE